MGDAAVRVTGVGKRYRIHPGVRSSSIKESASRWIGSSWRRRPGDEQCVTTDAESGWLWALRDVSFEIGRGEVVGLIGHNGAGKSVLLKILSRITDPTTGRAELSGRVGSLLEVGTGFHPELTGRENVYLNGAMLGMSRAEIRSRFDEIVDFAGLERFLETPVKYYSSGMGLRLAFSVAVHLEAEIIFLDEVWAAGDQDFQRRSLRKMHDLIGGGRTVIIVSHGLAQVSSLCQRTLLLDHGRLVADGPTQEIVRLYGSLDARIDAAPVLSDEASTEEGGVASTVGAGRVGGSEEGRAPSVSPRYRLANESLAIPRTLDYGHAHWPDLEKAPGSARVRLREVILTNRLGQACQDFFVGEEIGLRLCYDVLEEMPELFCGFALRDAERGVWVQSATNLPDPRLAARRRESRTPPGRYEAACAVLAERLMAAPYEVAVFIGTAEALATTPDVDLDRAIGLRVHPLQPERSVPRDVSAAATVFTQWIVGQVGDL